MPTPTIAIVGAGLAGAHAATAARQHGFEGRIVLIGDEPGLPYERPPLSKAVLRGEAAPETADVYDESHYAEQNIDLLAGRTVTAIEPGPHDGTGPPSVVLDGDERIDCVGVIIATGSEPRRLRVPGSELGGVHYLRTRPDSLALRDALTKSSRVAVIGAGWIGSEVAASARQMGVDVVIIDPLSVPLERVLGPTIGGAFARLHTDHGVELHLNASVSQFNGDHTVESVLLDDGTSEAVDLVVAGIGVTPRTAMAEQAGITVTDGIVVDQYLRTNVAGIYAAGDIALAWHPHYGTHIRVEHWANALNQGATAGANAAGDEQSYERLPYFFSDQYDMGMEYLGQSSPDDELTIRGDLAKNQYIAFWHRGGEIHAAMNVNIWDVVDDIRTLIETRTPVSPELLADESAPLSELVSDGTTGG